MDTHHHWELHKFLTHIFDKTFVAQKDYLPSLATPYIRDISWLPLWSQDLMTPLEEKTYKTVFVGTLNKTLNPERLNFFSQLQQKVDIFVTQGNYREIYPRSHIVVNQTVKGDLNYRVFEALAAGALLITERTGNGLLELFSEKKHLVTYEKNNVEEAAEKIRYYLNNFAQKEEIAKKGYEEVKQKHLAEHRAYDILRKGVSKLHSPMASFAAMVNFAVLAKLNEKVDKVLFEKALEKAIHYGVKALRRNEPLIEGCSVYAIYTGVKYDQVKNVKIGRDFLHKLANLHSNDLYLNFYLIWQHSKDASGAMTLPEEILTILYEGAEQVVKSCLKSPEIPKSTE
ncbi:MAG: glycosyltransferase family 1 protein [Candidatus Dadabacteria bacterium]|nr:MAG: glycosyltransferase family 1 protein [Candidatus Dadabacteria bacterium]